MGFAFMHGKNAEAFQRIYWVSRGLWLITVKIWDL